MRGRAASTLLENLIAVTITGVGLVAVVGLLNSSLLLSARSQTKVHAEQILQQLTESYAADAFATGPGVYLPAYRLDSLQITYRPQVRVFVYSGDPATVYGVETSLDWNHKGVAYRQQRVRYLCNVPR